MHSDWLKFFEEPIRMHVKLRSIISTLQNLCIIWPWSSVLSAKTADQAVVSSNLGPGQ